jgi:phage-related minor tail protein
VANPRSVVINFVGNDRVSDTIKGVSKSVDKLNDQVKKMAGPAMTAAGAAAGGAFVAGITGAIQLDSARGKLQAQLGLTKEESKRIGGVAGKLYADAYGDSMESVQTAVTAVIQNMNGMKTASSAALQQTTARAMDVATVMDEEVGAVTRAVAQMMKTGLAANAQEAFDLITRGAQTGANKAQDLLDTFNEYGTQFRKLGLDGQTAMGLIQQGLQGGARDADIVADAFKEFSIRAIDGSKGTIDGFKALGLNADQMAAQIAAGGPKASAGLDMVLDRLRGVKDPVKQSALAVQLFGTQAEDLGAALFKLDPSTAVAALGKVTGAADDAGKALGSTAQARFTAFTRTLQQDVTSALGSTVIWFEKHQTTAKALAVAVGVLTTAYVAYNIVAAVSAARTALMDKTSTAYLIKTKLIAAATKTWTAIQWLWNAAMSANPIGIVIVAIAALVAAVVLAYKNSETFRNIVQAAWAGIKAAVSAAWDFMKPVFEAIGSWVRDKLVPGFQYLWAVAKVVFTGVWEAVRTAWAVIKPVWDTVANVLKTVLGVAFTVFENLVKTVWIGIQLYVKVWWAAAKLIFDAVVLFVRNVLGPVFTWLYNNIIKPVWDGIRISINLAWAAIRIIFNSVKLFIEQTLAPVFTWLWRTIIVPAWQGIQTAISTVWNSGIRPVFDALKTAVGKVKDAFSTAVNGIQTIWNRLQDIAKKPVTFIIGLYNNGIVKLVNGIASLTGITTRLDPISGFARGGVMPGYAPGKDRLLAAVSPGESIFRPEFTKAVGSEWVTNANAIARSQGAGGVARWMSGQNRLGGEGMAFARGGIVPGFAGGFDMGGIVDGFVSGVKNFTFGNVVKAAEAMLGKLIGVIPGSGVFRDVIAAVPTWIKNNVLGWLKDKIGLGGKGMAAALNFARSRAGGPYVWGGVGPTGFDCSGFMSAITNVIHGDSPYSRLFSTHSFNGLSGPGGFVRDLRSGFMVGVTDAGVGHMAGTLLGTNVESSGSGGVQVGAGARGAYDGLFPYQYGLQADTGALALRPGWNPPVFNGTGKPEMLSTPAQSAQPIVIQVQPSGSGLDELFFTWLRNGVRSRGGNVQVVLGRG